MSSIIGITTEITDQITAATFSAPFASVTADRKWNVDFSLTELAASEKITVVARDVDSEPLSRTSNMLEHLVDIGIQKKMTDINDVAEMDTLIILASEILALLTDLSMATVSDEVQWFRIENKPFFWVDHLKQSQTFTSIISTFYKERVS